MIYPMDSDLGRILSDGKNIAFRNILLQTKQYRPIFVNFSDYMCFCVLGRGIVWFGAKYFEMLSFCHRIISDPNQSLSNISSDVPLKIILSPGTL